MRRLDAPKKCLTCSAESLTRGLCDACYQSARRLIRAGAMKECEAIERGLMLPKRRAGRPATAFRRHALDRKGVKPTS